MQPVSASRSGDALNRNIWNLYADVFCYGMLAGSAMAFLAVYAARLGATGLQVGLLTAGPAVINLLFSLPAGRWLENRDLIRAVFRSSLAHRAGYLPLIVLPWLLPAADQVWAVLLIVGLMSVPGTVLAIAFNAMFADVVPAELRARVVGRRSALLAISTSASTLASGWILDLPLFPLNYQIVFGLGALGAALSSVFLERIRLPKDFVPPPRLGRPLYDNARPGLVRFLDAVRGAPGLRFLTRSAGRPLLRPELVRGPFGLFLLAYLAFYTCQFLAVPLVPLFLVRELNLSDGVISFGNALFYVLMMAGSLALRRVSARLGHHGVLVVSAALYSLYPLLNGLASNATLFLVASFTGGAVWALLNAGLVNRLMERVPADDRPAHMALHNLVLNLGILAGSLAGPLIADWIGLRQALLLVGALRLAAGILLGIWA